GLVGEADVHRVGVGGRMDRDGADAHFVTGAMDPERDLAAVGDQQLLDFHGREPQPTMRSGWSNSTGWPSATMIFLTTPPDGAVIGFITFIASTISRVSPAFTASPTSANCLAPGSGERYAVPTIGDLTVLPAISSGTGSTAAAGAGADAAVATAGTAAGAE